MRTRAIVAVFVGMGVFAFAGVQDGVLLRKELKEGATETYAVTIQGNQTIEAMGQPMEMTFNGGYNWIFEFKKIDTAKNLAEVDITVKDMKFEMTGPMADAGGGNNLPKETKSSAKLDNRYRMTETKAPGGNAMMALAMGAGAAMSPFIELPEKAVKPGDTWPVVIPKSIFTGDADLKMNASFKGDGKIGEISGNQIELAGTVPMNIDLTKLFEAMAASGSDPTQGMQMAGTMKGTMNTKIVAILDKTTGKALTMVMTVGTDATMDLTSPMTMSIPTKGMTTMKFVSK